MSSPPFTMRFLAFPSEVRVLIYEYLLVSSRDGSLRMIKHNCTPATLDAPIEFHGLCSKPATCVWCAENIDHHACWSEDPAYGLRPACPKVGRTGGQVHPSILGASRLIYNEAMPMLYLNVQITIILTGHQDVHDILMALPKFPYHIPQIHFKICAEMMITAAERELMMDVVDILEVALNKYRPTLVSAIMYHSPGNTRATRQGVTHEIFRKFDLMPTNSSVVIMSAAKRESLYSRSVFDNEACKGLTSTMTKFHNRLARKRRDDLSQSLEQTRCLRQNIEWVAVGWSLAAANPPFKRTEVLKSTIVKEDKKFAEIT